MGKAICLPNPLRPRLQPLYCMHLHSGDKEEIVCHAVVSGHLQREAGACIPPPPPHVFAPRSSHIFTKIESGQAEGQNLLPSRYVWRTCAYVSILALFVVMRTR